MRLEKDRMTLSRRSGEKVGLLAITCFTWIVLVGCKPSSQPEVAQTLKQSTQHSSSTSDSSLPVPVQSHISLEQWRNAVNKAFDKVNVSRLRDKKNPAYIENDGKTDENGVTEFFACFDKSPPKCEFSASGKRDSFGKIQFFMEPTMELEDIRAMYARDGGKPFIRAYVSLKDCSQPKIILLPTFRATSWIFLEHFGLMLDGSLVIERKFDSSQVDRDNSHNEVSESAYVVLNEQEIITLRRIGEAKQVLVRLTGKKGYVGIEQERMKTIVQGITRLLRIHDALDQAVKNLGQVKDPACPL
mgnify:CR=1 FL=1